MPPYLIPKAHWKVHIVSASPNNFRCKLNARDDKRDYLEKRRKRSTRETTNVSSQETTAVPITRNDIQDRDRDENQRTRSLKIRRT